ncbi:hypothetical protein C8R46DRAFT_1041313 [Mycena filopes]|nr:hypothetical protein C8R46DRAFT_1041313 [Mycena filopes]
MATSVLLPFHLGEGHNLKPWGHVIDLESAVSLTLNSGDWGARDKSGVLQPYGRRGAASANPSHPGGNTMFLQALSKDATRAQFGGCAAPGWLLSASPDIPAGVGTIFVLRQLGWEYQGQYALEHAGKLSPQQITAGGEQFQKKLAATVKSTKAPLAFRKMAARIHTRGLPAGVIKATKKRKAKLLLGAKSKSLSTAEVTASLMQGKEHLDLIRLNYVSYDHEFAQLLATAHHP